jgi:hypothetical protein
VVGDSTHSTIGSAEKRSASSVCVSRNSSDRRRSRAVALIVLRSGHPGGDPGGSIAAEARIAVSRAVPSGSQVVGRQTVESTYDGCWGDQGSGWAPVTSGEAFKTRLGDPQVISDVRANLRASGWIERAENATGASWTKTFNDGSAAKLRLRASWFPTGGRPGSMRRQQVQLAGDLQPSKKLNLQRPAGVSRLRPGRQRPGGFLGRNVGARTATPWSGGVVTPAHLPDAL